MSKVAIMTDSNSGITQAAAKELEVCVLPMPFTIDGQEFFEDINLTQEEFYEKLTQDAQISTSQPSPETVLKTWEELLKTYDEVVYIPMSSGLSGSCQTAMMLAEDFDGKVQVVNNQRISVTLRHSVMDAKKLAAEGKSAAEIKELLEASGLEASIYITIATLKYLAKGGRLTPAAAAIGTMLRLKPVLTIQGERLDAFSKARTVSQAKKTMLDAVRNDLETRFADVDKKELRLDIAHTNSPQEAEKFKKEVEEAFPEYQIGYADPLSLSVSCHIGDGAIAMAITRIMHD